MKTIKEFKSLLFDEQTQKNTLLGYHLNSLFKESDLKVKATIHNLDEKIEVIVQMNSNNINAFTDSYKLGSVSKAFYEVKLKEYSEF